MVDGMIGSFGKTGSVDLLSPIYRYNDKLRRSAEERHVTVLPGVI